MANEEPQPLPDNSSTEHWLYPGRRYLFWTDWLIRCDSRQNFDVMKKVFADLSTKFFKDPNSQVKFFKDLGDRIEKSRITFSGQVEHWVPQADDRASRLLAGEARHLDEEPRQIDILGISPSSTPRSTANSPVAAVRRRPKSSSKPAAT